MKNSPVYLDFAAATPLDPLVKEAMLPYLEDEYGNPSALYSLGTRARKAVDDARETAAQFLNCRASEVVFTGSGTESDNLAIFGVTQRHSPPSGGAPPLGGECGHIITTNFEHHAVLNPCRALEKAGYGVTYLKVGRDGLITSRQVRDALREDTLLVSIMYANNEVGTIEPIVDLTHMLRKWKKENGRKENDPPFFHTDACQAAAYLDMDVQRLGVDLLTMNGSKLYGPKGVGVLYVRRGVKLKPMIYGGGQEFGLRSGTENVAGIVGMAAALQLSQKVKESESSRVLQLRDRLIAGILESIKGSELNGHPAQRLPNNVNISISGIEAEAMLFYLDEAGIAAATGSACESAGTDPSQAVCALGKSRDVARSAVRLTLGRTTTREDVDYVLKVLPQLSQKLRYR